MVDAGTEERERKVATERTVLVRLKANTSDFNRAMMSARASVKGLTDEIDTTNDRTAWLAQSVLGLGPAFVPIAAAAVPAIAGLATQMTVAAAAAGTAALAFNGIGDGLKALNDYQLDPSAANMTKLAEAMDKIGPAGENFVMFLDEIGPKFSQLGMTAREEMFPGVQEGITLFMQRLPQVNNIVGELAGGMGDLASASGEALASGRFNAFFDYMEQNARPILMDMGRGIGGIIEGLANMMVAMRPLTDDFSDGFANMGASFAEWSRGLETNDSFQSFLDYVQDAGPKVLDFLGSLTSAFVGILHAAAPVGEVLLPLFSQFLDIIALIANTPLGSAFVALGATIGLIGRSMALLSVTSGGVIGKVTQLSRANARAAVSTRTLGTDLRLLSTNALTAGAATERMAAQSRVAASNVRAQGRAFAGTAGQVALLGVVATGAADGVGLSNTAMLTLAGTLAGPWGAAAGAAAGLFLDIKEASSGVGDSLREVDNAIQQTDLGKAEAELRKILDVEKDVKDATGFTDFFSDIGESGGASLGKLLGFDIEGSDEIQNAIAKVKELRDLTTAPAPGGSGLMSMLPGFAAHATQFRSTAAATRDANMALREYLTSLDIFQGRLSQQQGLIAFRDGLRQLGQTVKDNPLGVNLKDTKQGDAVRGQLLGVISTVQTLGSEMKGLEHVRFMRSARKDILQRAAELGIPLGRVQTLLDRMGILDRTHAKPRTTERGANEARTRIERLRAQIAALKSKSVRMDEKGAAAARDRIAALRREIAGLHDKTVTVRYNILRGKGQAPAVGLQAPKRDGGKLVAMFPGETRGPTDDTLDIRASHDEWVIRAKSARKYGDRFMEDINEGRFPIPPGYKEGGKIGATPARVSVAAPAVAMGDNYFRVIVDGRELVGVIDERIDMRDDVAGSYVRAARDAGDE